MGARRVAEIAVSPAQGFALHHPQEVFIGPRGVAENRRFCLIDGKGAAVKLSPGAVPAHAYLFGEDPTRVVLSFAPGKQKDIEETCRRHGVPCEMVGEVGGDALKLEGMTSVPVASLNRAYRSGIPSVSLPNTSTHRS